MTRDEAIKILRKAFAAVTSTQQERLRYHADRDDVRVLCGVEAGVYLAPGGA